MLTPTSPSVGRTPRLLNKIVSVRRSTCSGWNFTPQSLLLTVYSAKVAERGLFNESTLCMQQLKNKTLNVMPWYVVYCVARKEHQVVEQFAARLALESYLPLIPQRVGGQIQHVPLFPRYLFIHANLHELGVSAISAIHGVQHIVKVGDQLQPVPEEVMQKLRQQVEELNRLGIPPAYSLRPGDVVRVKNGPLQGLDVIFAGQTSTMQRVQILLEFLGRINKVDVDVGMLEREATVAPQDRPRLTRGGGRRVRYK